MGSETSIDEQLFETDRTVQVSKTYLDIKHEAVYERLVNDITLLLHGSGDIIPLGAHLHGSETWTRNAYHLGGGITAVLYCVNTKADRRYRGHIHVQLAHDKAAGDETRQRMDALKQKFDEFYDSAQQLGRRAA